MDKTFTMENPYRENVDKMYTYLRAYLKGAGMTESLRALSYARDKHKNQTRKDGIPYITHPLSMACYGAALGIRDDTTMCTILLHDVCEDCGIPFRELPFNECVQRGVQYVTITKFDTDRSKDETKRRYYSELIYSPEACVTKGIDKYKNLSDMVFALSDDAIGKNAAETDILLLPVLKDAKDKYSYLSYILYVLRTNLKSIAGIYMKIYNDDYMRWKTIFEQKNNVSC